jgi:Flp pilus assembly protein TadB
VTGLQLAIIAGGLIGLGVSVIVWRFATATPDLEDALTRLSPQGMPTAGDGPPTATDLQGRVGVWAMRSVPARWWGRVPDQDLAVLRMPRHRFYGEKVTSAALGLAAPPVLALVAELIGFPLPFTIPVLASLGLAAALFVLPNLTVATDAARERAVLLAAVTAYVDLVALERRAGSGPRQAMERAADVGDCWLFTRIEQTLARTGWSGEAPWAALHGLADELGIPALHDVADIMRLSGEEGAQVADHLSSRAKEMRDAALAQQITAANQVSERMALPITLLVFVFTAILITPPLMRIFFGGA